MNLKIISIDILFRRYLKLNYLLLLDFPFFLRYLSADLEYSVIFMIQISIYTYLHNVYSLYLLFILGLIIGFMTYFIYILLGTEVI